MEALAYNPFDYQSECHCSKTPLMEALAYNPFDYQSECHCSKTSTPGMGPSKSNTSGYCL